MDFISIVLFFAEMTDQSYYKDIFPKLKENMSSVIKRELKHTLRNVLSLKTSLCLTFYI